MPQKSDAKRTYVWEKGKTIVLLTIGEQEREIQNAQVLSQKDICPFSYCSVVNVIKVRRQKDICMGKAKRTCVLLAIGEEEREIQNAQVNFIKVRRQKKVICRSARLALKILLTNFREKGKFKWYKVGVGGYQKCVL